jgi:hypothetical protein
VGGWSLSLKTDGGTISNQESRPTRRIIFGIAVAAVATPLTAVSARWSPKRKPDLPKVGHRIIGDREGFTSNDVMLRESPKVWARLRERYPELRQLIAIPFERGLVVLGNGFNRHSTRLNY